jgi:DNA-binding XRE family transcriptional regulator
MKKDASLLMRVGMRRCEPPPDGAKRVDKLADLATMLQEARALVARLQNEVAAFHAEADADHPIVVWRKTRGLSQSALAKMAGISAPALWRIEHLPGFKAREQTREKLAAALSVPEVWLFAPDPDAADDMDTSSMLQVQVDGDQ